MFLAFLQSATQAPSTDVLPSILSGGIGAGGIGTLVLWVLRQDRADRAEERKREADRYAEVAKDYMAIVINNTAAMTRLGDLLDSKPRT